MIVISVLSFNGAPSDGRSASFDELGGSIGRADTNQLVLPDPERSISRVHAQVVFRNGGYELVDNSTNGTFLNADAQRLSGPRTGAVPALSPASRAAARCPDAGTSARPSR